MNIFDEHPQVSFAYTGKVIGRVAADVKDMVADEPVRLVYRELELVPLDTGMHYRPPGVWCEYHGGLPKWEAPLAVLFPNPHHPLELVAAYFYGFGGVKAAGAVLTDDDHKSVADMQNMRYAGWPAYTVKMAEAMDLTPSQVRVLYHLLTPLHTNGAGNGVETRALIAARRHLYDSLGFSELKASDAIEQASGRRGHYGKATVPFRRTFWGIEVTGRVEL